MSGSPGCAEVDGQVLEEEVEVAHPPEVDLGWGHRGHLPVEDGHHLVVAEDHVADPAVPQERTSDPTSVGKSLAPARRSSARGGARRVGRPPSRDRRTSGRSCARGWWRPAVRCSRKARSASVGVRVWMPARARSAESCRRRRSASDAVEHPVVTEGVGHDVAGHEPSTRSMTKKAPPSGPGSASYHSGSGTGTSVRSRDELHDPELHVEVVGREDRARRWPAARCGPPGGGRPAPRPPPSGP